MEEIQMINFQSWNNERKAYQHKVNSKLIGDIKLGVFFSSCVLFGLSPYIRDVIVDKVDAAQVSDIDAEIGEETISIINTVADEYNICPELVEAVIYHESRGNQYVVSSSGDCVGLAQINYKYSDYTMQELFEKENNIRACFDLIDYYHNALGDDLEIVLAAYNCGEYSKVVKGLQNGTREHWDYSQEIIKMSEMLEEVHEKEKK